METKRYMKPLIEVVEICVNGALMASPVQNPLPIPPGGPAGQAPKHLTPVF